MAKSARKFQQQTEEILAALDILAEYRELGLLFASDKPRASGKIEAYAAGRDDNKPSAWVDVNTGRYGDSSSESGECLSLFDFAVKYGNKGFADWLEVRRHYAKKAGIKLTNAKPPENPAEVLEFLSWDEGYERLTQLWCATAKKGTSLEAVKAAGGRIARYPCYFVKDKDGKPTGERKIGKFTVIALPAYGPKLLNDDPQAWVIWNITGQTLPVYRGKDRQPDQVKMKSVGPTHGTLMNVHAIGRIGQPTVDYAWKTAGPTDMMALMTAIPAELRDQHIVTCNASTETGDVPEEIAAVFTGCKTLIVHDADEAGEAGAVKWLAAVAGVSSDVRHVRLPYVVQPKGGEDTRDYLHRDQHPYSDLLELAEQAQSVTPQSLAIEKKSGDRSQIEVQAETIFEEQIVKNLGLDVLGEFEDNNHVELFVEFHRKSHIVKQVSKLTYEDMLQICGPPAKSYIYTGQDEPPDGMFTLRDVKRSVGLLAGYKRIGEQTKIGVGCWQGLRPDGSEDKSVVLVNAGEGAELNGSYSLTRVAHPRCKGHLLDLSGSEPWYDFERINQYVAQCDSTWAARVMNESIELFGKWRWKHQVSSPIVVTGLIFATWVQAFWNWRPQIAITGASKAGKTTFFECLESMFSQLSFRNSQSSAAGIRQKIRNTSRVILCDEFDSSKYREEILEMLRTSGRGDKTVRGTAGQRAQQFGLRHIVWVAGIESGLKRTPDRNRFISLELVPPPEPEQGKLILPPPSYRTDLGQRMLAVAIKYVSLAKPMAARLKDRRHEGIDDRMIESYAVPAAMLAVLQGLDDDGANELMAEMLADIQREESGKMADESDLMHAILSSHVHNGKSFRSVAQLLESAIHRSSDHELSEDALAKVGIKLDACTPDDHRAGILGDECLAIAHGAVSEHLLKRTAWEHKSIDQILQRIPGAIRSRRRIGGQRLRCILVSKDVLVTEYLGEDDHKALEASEQQMLGQTTIIDY